MSDQSNACATLEVPLDLLLLTISCLISNVDYAKAVASGINMLEEYPQCATLPEQETLCEFICHEMEKPLKEAGLDIAAQGELGCQIQLNFVQSMRAFGAESTSAAFEEDAS